MKNLRRKYLSLMLGLCLTFSILAGCSGFNIPRQVLEKVSLLERQMKECGKTMAEIRELLTMARNSKDV